MQLDHFRNLVAFLRGHVECFAERPYFLVQRLGTLAHDAVRLDIVIDRQCCRACRLRLWRGKRVKLLRLLIASATAGFVGEHIPQRGHHLGGPSELQRDRVGLRHSAFGWQVAFHRVTQDVPDGDHVHLGGPHHDERVAALLGHDADAPGLRIGWCASTAAHQSTQQLGRVEQGTDATATTRPTTRPALGRLRRSVEDFVQHLGRIVGTDALQADDVRAFFRLAAGVCEQVEHLEGELHILRVVAGDDELVADDAEDDVRLLRWGLRIDDLCPHLADVAVHIRIQWGR